MAVIVINPYQYAAPIGPSADPYSDYVSLLLHGNGTNNSTTFTDNSTHVHTVTAGGDAKISTTQSKFGGASMYFDGSGDYLSIPDDTSFHLGSDDFTFEFWTYLGSTTGNFINKRVSTSANEQYLHFTISGGDLVLYATSNGSSWDIASNFNFGNTTLSTGQWYHIALVRNGTEIATYVNGIKSPNTITTSAAIQNGGTNPLRIAGDVPYANYLNGYIDDFRLTQGVARYTSNFTRPTAPFPDPPIVTSGLVLHLDAGDSASYSGNGNTWTDLSGNGNDGTLTGGPTYSSADGGSIVFDGTNDYVALGTQINSDIQLTDVTISFWAYIDSTASDQMFVSMNHLDGNLPLIIWHDRSVFANSLDNSGAGDVGGGTTNAVVVMVTDSSSERRFGTSDNALSATTWHNISVVLDVTNNSFYTYIDGVEEAKWVSNNTSGGIRSTSYDFRIGGGSPYLDGRISNFLVYNRALTQSEITRNYNALRDRYGL